MRGLRNSLGGVTLVTEPFVLTAISRKLAFFADPFGNLIEVPKYGLEILGCTSRESSGFLTRERGKDPLPRLIFAVESASPVQIPRSGASRWSLRDRSDSYR